MLSICFLVSSDRKSLPQSPKVYKVALYDTVILLQRIKCMVKCHPVLCVLLDFFFFSNPDSDLFHGHYVNPPCLINVQEGDTIHKLHWYRSDTCNSCLNCFLIPSINSCLTNVLPASLHMSSASCAPSKVILNEDTPDKWLLYYCMITRMTLRMLVSTLDNWAKSSWLMIYR